VDRRLKKSLTLHIQGDPDNVRPQCPQHPLLLQVSLGSAHPDPRQAGSAIVNVQPKPLSNVMPRASCCICFGLSTSTSSLIHGLRLMLCVAFRALHDWNSSAMLHITVTFSR
jgi:hypothetical protein